LLNTTLIAIKFSILSETDIEMRSTAILSIFCIIRLVQLELIKDFEFFSPIEPIEIHSLTEKTLITLSIILDNFPPENWKNLKNNLKLLYI